MPILMIAPKHMAKDVKKGFLMGVDDYMTCPVDEGHFPQNRHKKADSRNEKELRDNTVWNFCHHLQPICET
jgi:PleD family two-component response regulator